MVVLFVVITEGGDEEAHITEFQQRHHQHAAAVPSRGRQPWPRVTFVFGPDASDLQKHSKRYSHSPENVASGERVKYLAGKRVYNILWLTSRLLRTIGSARVSASGCTTVEHCAQQRSLPLT
jgi:hypothetical protein